MHTIQDCYNLPQQFQLTNHNKRIKNMQKESETFTVLVQGQKLVCPKQLASMSTFLNNILYLGELNMDSEDEDQKISIDIVDLSSFKQFISFCEINDFKDPEVPTPIRTNDLYEVLDKKNYHFISKYDIKSSQLSKLEKAAQFLGCKGLQKVIAAKFACLIYFKDSKESFLQKCKQLGVNPKITIEDQFRFRKLYSFFS